MENNNNFMSRFFAETIQACASVSKQEDGDYIGDDGLLYCGKCHTKKQKRFEDDPSFGVLAGMVVPCLCECGKTKKEIKDRETQDIINRGEAHKLRYKAFSEAKMAAWTFEADESPDSKISQVMRRYAENFADMKKNGKGLILYGDVGTGKSFYAACVANAVIDKGYSVLMTNFSDIINKQQEKFDGKTAYMSRVSDDCLLVIDDLGIERETSFMREQVYNIIDTRYRSGKPFIITTNLSIQELMNDSDIDKRRIYDRILEMCLPIEVKGKSRRAKKAGENFQDMRDLLGL